MPLLKHTKIVCTVGPASNTRETLTKMVEAGMNVARLNFSHGTHEEHAKMIADLRAVSAATGEPIALLQDLQGPKIRVGNLPKEGVQLVTGKDVVFTSDEKAPLPAVFVSYEYLHEDLKPGDQLLLDDGLLEAKVKSIKGRNVICEVVNGGTLTSHKGVNMPKTALRVSAITPKDREDAEFGIAQNVDWIALSFVRTAEDVKELKGIIASRVHSAAARPRVLAKIEKPEAIKNLDAIIAEVDGIMVARGDLGVEMRAEEVPMLQKRIVAKCLAVAKPVIVATQMLDSMIRNPRPTRAEVSDVANAVIDHADAVMLSAESAAGKYPVETVDTMAKIVRETESSSFDDLPTEHPGHPDRPLPAAISEVASILAADTKAKAIIIVSGWGDAGHYVSSFRPDVPVIAVCSEGAACTRLALVWGVTPIFLGKLDDKAIDTSIKMAKKKKLVKKGDHVIILQETGHGEDAAQRIDFMMVA